MVRVIHHRPPSLDSSLGEGRGAGRGPGGESCRLQHRDQLYQKVGTLGKQIYTLLVSVYQLQGQENNSHHWEDSVIPCTNTCGDSIMGTVDTGVCNLRPAGHTQPRTAGSAAQHKIVHLLKTSGDIFFGDYVSRCI